MIGTSTYLGVIASILVLCQWFVFLSIRTYLFQKGEGIRRRVAYPVLIAFGLITIVASRLEFGSEILPPGTFGRQLASILVFSYLGWVITLSAVFLFIKAVNSLIKFGNAIRASKMIEATPGSQGADHRSGSYAHVEGEKIQKPEPRHDQVQCSSESVSVKAMPIDHQHLTRRRFLKVATASGLMAAAGFGLEGIAEGYSRPVIEKYEHFHDLLAGAPKPITLIHVTDWHFGMFFGRRQLRDLVNHLNSIEGDALCITGDIFHSAATLVEQSTPLLKKLKARPLGNFAVLGNHDFYAGSVRSVKVLEEAGITLLRNRWITLRVGNSTIHIGGVDDPLVPRWHGNKFPAFDALMSTAPVESGVRLLLSHRPGAFPLAAQQEVDLILAGHTHGGQIVIPMPGMERGLSVADMVSEYSRGWYRSHTSLMYLNRGVGFTFLPWRIHCPPEIAVIRLNPQEAGTRKGFLRKG